MKRCPFCTGRIQNDALVCKHCGREVTAHQASNLSLAAERARMTRRVNRNKLLSKLLLVFGGFWLIMIVPFTLSGPDGTNTKTWDEVLTSALAGGLLLGVAPLGLGFYFRRQSKLLAEKLTVISADEAPAEEKSRTSVTLSQPMISAPPAPLATNRSPLPQDKPRLDPVGVFRCEEQAAMATPDFREAVKALKSLYRATRSDLPFGYLNYMEGGQDACFYVEQYLDGTNGYSLDDLDPFRRSIAHSKSYSHEVFHQAKLRVLEWAYERLTSAPPAAQTATPAMSCAVCSKVIQDFHYSFEHIVMRPTVGWHCSECGRVFCKEHLEEKDQVADHCPSCDGKLIWMHEGPASSSMVESARGRGFYNSYIRPPGSERPVTQD